MEGFGFVITAAGKALLAKLLAGDRLVLSRAEVGSGRPGPEQDPALLTDLIAPEKRAAFTVPEVKENVASFLVEYRNDLHGGLEKGFWIREFGVFAMDPQEGEILLYYASLGEFPQYAAAYEGGWLDIRRFPVAVALSTDAEIVLQNPGDSILLSEDLSKHNRDLLAHENRFEKLNPDVFFIRLEHGLGAYPLINLCAFQYGAGMGGAGEGPAGGSALGALPCRALYHDRNTLSVYTVKAVAALGTPQAHRLDNRRYLAVFPGESAAGVFLELFVQSSYSAP